MMFITTSHSQPAHHPEIGHSNLLLTWSSHAMLSKAQAEVKKQPWTQLWCCYSYSTWRTWTWWFSTSLYCSSEFVSSWILAYCKPHRGTSRRRMTTEKTQSEVTQLTGTSVMTLIPTNYPQPGHGSLLLCKDITNWTNIHHNYWSGYTTHGRTWVVVHITRLLSVT